jgi:hypothetical protein
MLRKNQGIQSALFIHKNKPRSPIVKLADRALRI